MIGDVVSTYGDASPGVFAGALGVGNYGAGQVNVTVNSVLTQGDFSSGIIATVGGGKMAAAASM